MARNRKYGGMSRNYRNLPITHRSNIPNDDTSVLQHEPIPPLEHGGIYEEMGADFTYEEMIAYDHAPRTIMSFNESDQRVSAIGWYVGTLALVVAISALFIWPFWTGLSALALSSMSYSQGTKAIAWLSGTIAVVAIASSIFEYFILL
ncbi:MAG: hypothetical protein NAG76_21160 [Candidatus Pristimantibacillus lignocellulolyticus]|uniref:Uncharacterized protein n=1 Tax=Candidatus Pristimantibacillus lignocellulolyticus TaxID=2994561 RepID=A0A9J6ZDS9_9BACL|nr:MAG: hypothetical protein NAG76_21160 [Candidatus Pristimantibacillus lignocellulolyticus]